MSDSTKYFAPRTCTVVDDAAGLVSGGRHAPLGAYSDTAAYVLIAEPGAGKTVAFKTEAARQGAIYETVRNFLRVNKSEWRGKTLFLDGLDESRAGPGDARTPLDDVVMKLDGLGGPPFRLSCRWRDWLAANDKEGLREVSPDRAITVIRLDPLSKNDITQILARNHNVTDPEDFVEAARQRRIDNLLSNPQNLELLAEAVAQGKWPESRRDTFEQACGILVREPNSEHRAADPSTTDANALLEEAGRLCAVQILAGIAGYTLPDIAEPDQEYPSVTELAADTDGRSRQVLGTRLFSGASEGQLAPVHRQIAEYLAARHISRCLDDGLPLPRVLSLITGFDGELLQGLRNFASWLAVHNRGSRRCLSRLDPSGLIHAADRDTYSPEEKREIVLNLCREWDHNAHASRSVGRVTGIGRIVSPELEETLREIFSADQRDQVHQCYILLLMQMLADGEPLLDLADVLEAIVRDSTWYPSIRCGALDVLTGYAERDSLSSAALTTLMHDIGGGSVEDPGDELLGILLKHLFPRILTLQDVLPYLRAPRLTAHVGEYSMFWTEHVVRQSVPEQLAELLDAIIANGDRFKSFMHGEIARNTGMARLPVEALERFLRDSRGDVAAHRLYKWLRVFSDSGFETYDRDISSLQFGLRWNEETLKALIAHGVNECIARAEECTGLVDCYLFGARPFDYGPWCVDQALAAGGQPDAESFYLGELVGCLMEGQEAHGLTVEKARAALSSDKSLLNRFNQMLELPVGPASRPEEQMPADPPDESEHRSSQPAPKDSPPPAAIVEQVDREQLHWAASAYLGIDDRFAGETPRERLRAFADGSPEIADALLMAMEATVQETHLPKCEEVVRSLDRQKINLFVLPFTAGLHSLERSGRLMIGDLTRDRVRLAVTIVYTLSARAVAPDSTSSAAIHRPQWFQTLLERQPGLVAGILCDVAVTKLETGVQTPIELHELRYADDHEKVAKVAAVPLLQRFPPVKSDSELQALCWTLHSALVHGDRTEVSRLARNRLDQGSPELNERTCWTLAGFLADPQHWREDFGALPDDEVCSMSAGMFLASARVPREDIARDLEPSDVRALVEFAGTMRPRGMPEYAYRAVSHAISSLEAETNAAATDVLQELADSSNAQPWLGSIGVTRLRHVQRRREHEFRHCTIQQVLETLNNQRPANVGDLAALVSDELTSLSQKIRRGSTSDWRQYWNVDRYNRPTGPKPEEACRDAVLSDLQDRLAPREIDAQPEGVYANDRRADIRVSFGGFNIPVEIKRSCHDDVWTAVREQLTANYTPDPGVGGFGVYLVFWFGDTEACRPTKCGNWRPRTPGEMEQKLQQSLCDRDRNLISIFVVDVSVPPGKVMGTPAT